MLACLLLCAALLPAKRSHAQYCTPVFTSGCFNWTATAITVGSINWTLGSAPCSDWDYTSMITSLTTGVPHAMTVENHQWCGCAVWVDLNSDLVFDPSELLFHQYIGNQYNTYNFSITIPNGTAVGTYRMRVISPWGSDGVTSANGTGPCGPYTYGGYQDFTIFVSGPQGLQGPAGGGIALFSVRQDPLRETMQVVLAHGASSHGDLLILDAAGRAVLRRKVSGESVTLSTGGLSHGVYLLQYREGERRQTARIIL